MMSFFASIDSTKKEKANAINHAVRKRGVCKYEATVVLEQICKKRKCIRLFVL